MPDEMSGAQFERGWNKPQGGPIAFDMIELDPDLYRDHKRAREAEKEWEDKYNELWKLGRQVAEVKDLLVKENAELKERNAFLNKELKFAEDTLNSNCR